MARYQSIPKIIEAERFDGHEPYPKGVCVKPCLDGDWIKPHVHTIHGNQAVILDLGDWVVPEPDGIHYYPVKDHIFQDRYEPLDQ